MKKNMKMVGKAVEIKVQAITAPLWPSKRKYNHFQLFMWALLLVCLFFVVMDVLDTLAIPPDQPTSIKNVRQGRMEALAMKRNGWNPKRSSSLRKMARLSMREGGHIYRMLDRAENTSEARFENPPPPVCKKSIIAPNEAINMRYLDLPCGFHVGSSVTIVGIPGPLHWEYRPNLGQPDNNGTNVEVAQFVVEIHGKSPQTSSIPTLLHFNPRLKGDWSGLPVIEHNTCFRNHWGVSQRCTGSPTPFRKQTVDGLLKCEGWMENIEEKQHPLLGWLYRLIGIVEKSSTKWKYPFSLNQVFVLTIRAGQEGYHANVDGRHITSFPYRTEFWEDTSGLSINGDVEIISIITTSLPSSYPYPSHEKFSEKWKSPPLPRTLVNLFIGILSASNHFDERMAIRKTWMLSSHIKTSEVVPRFFVALHQSKEINLKLKEEADYYGDMVILPFMDHYDLVVLKTLAICEYGVKNLLANYIMKCDDDTFVRVDAVLKEVGKYANEEMLYLGSINMFHRPLRTGKWAVTFDEWPDDIYPPYANGPGYILSRSVTRAIVSRHHQKDLELFKMEDVSMGLWVQQLNQTEAVKYVHNWRFFQDGCMKSCLIAHYQSPRQMMCMWKKLQSGASAFCCQT